jgi:uncharacterized coiled-coil DUF342 family protein
MKIIELHAENIKNLKVIEIKANDVNILEGKIGAGKSSILDSIFMALTGGKVARPIREGQEKGNIKVNLGEYIVKKVFTSAGERLEVLSPEGAKYPSPQALLNKILGKLAFDPLAFAHMESLEQKNLLKQMLNLDFSSLDQNKTNLYNERTFKNREIKNLEGILSSLKEYSDLPAEEISLNEQIAKIEELEKYQDAYNHVLAERARNAKMIEENQKHISSLEKEIVSLQQQIISCKNDIQMYQDKNATLKIPDDVSNKIVESKENLKSIEQINIKVRETKKYQTTKQKLAEFTKEANMLTQAIEAIDQEKVTKLQACKFPIEGLSIDEISVLYKGRPFTMLSTGEQLKISTAIAMALNPTLRIIILREGSLLDTNGLQAIIDLAKEKDYQLWIEKVSDEKTVGIYIEDGQVAQ